MASRSAQIAQDCLQRAETWPEVLPTRPSMAPRVPKMTLDGLALPRKSGFKQRGSTPKLSRALQSGNPSNREQRRAVQGAAAAAWKQHKVAQSRHEPNQPRAAQNCAKQHRAAQGSSGQPRAAQKQPRAAQSSSGQPRAEQLRAAQEQRKVAQSSSGQLRAAQSSPGAAPSSQLTDSQQPRAAAQSSSPEQPKAAQSSLEQPRAA